MARKTRAGGAKKRPTLYRPHETTKSETLVLALRAHRHARYAEACELYRAELAADPGNIDAWMNLGSALVMLGLARTASQAFDEASRLAPNDARVARDVGIGLASVGLFDEARVAFERALALAPQSVGPRLVLARLCLDTGKSEEAVAHARRAVELAPSDPSTHLELARALFDDTKPDAARDAMLSYGAQEAYDYAQGKGARVFSSKRATLLFALAQSPAEGDVLEFGVRHGVSTRVLASAVARLHGFDSFEGLPEAWLAREPGAFTTSGELPELPTNVTLHVGLFDQTLPQYVASSNAPLRLVHIDSDLYASAKCVLTLLADRIRPGVVIVFDEYLGHQDWREHEFRAFQEAVSARGWRYEYLVLNWITGQAVARIL